MEKQWYKSDGGSAGIDGRPIDVDPFDWSMIESKDVI